MLQCIRDCLGWARAPEPLVISRPIQRLRPLTLQPPRRAPMRPDLLPPVPTASEWSLPAALNRPTTPVVAFRPERRPQDYDRAHVRNALARTRSPEIHDPPPRPLSIPTDADEEDALPRLSYDAKGKWPAGRPPTPKSIELPEMSLDGHALSSRSSSGSDYSDESQRSIFFAP